MTGPVRLLYIDDDTGLGVLLTRALGSHGCAVTTVQNGEEAMARLKSAPFDIVALDHNLTNEVGLDLIPRIRALPNPPPIIYVTGSEDARIAVAALKAGAVDYVWKDVQGHYRELLREAIKTALEQERLKRASQEAQRQVAEARDRAEAMLKEVNHRVANSLAMVSSFVQLQSSGIADPAARAALKETTTRIGAIAGVHRRLYTSSDVGVVEINAYLKSLVEDLAGSTREGLVFASSQEAINVGTDKVVALGVIVAELVTNASKYAYPQGAPHGAIRVAAEQEDGVVTVVVEDDGVGWTGTGAVQGSGLGTRIIKAMLHTLQAELSYEPRGKGTRAVVRFTA
jgi:two-component sensor histidine kinase/CheY-like chemotaxis protein